MQIPIAGVRAGHWTDHQARRGCTVVLLPDGTVASGEVRGGAPATREFELLRPDRLVDRVHAVVMSGGSAFGLAAASGVAEWLEQQGRGFPTPAGRVPIVVGMALFDLPVGDPSVRPGAAEGFAAAAAAEAAGAGMAGESGVETGLVGVGAGCTVGKWRGMDEAVPSGIGGAVAQRGALAVAALVASNAFGSIDDGSDVLARLADLDGTFDPVLGTGAAGDDGLDGTDGTGTTGGNDGGIAQNTTIGVVLTNARLDKVGCLVAAQGAHDGLARAILPPHCRVDGDAFVAAATGEVDAPVDLVRLLALATVEAAIRSLAR